MTDRNFSLQAWELVDRLDHIEEQLGGLFPDRYVPFARAAAERVPADVVELVRAGNKIAAMQALLTSFLSHPRCGRRSTRNGSWAATAS